MQLGGRSATWSANMSSNSRNVKLPFLTTRCQYQVVDMPVDLQLWSANIEFLTTRCQTRGVDWPLDLPIWALTVEMWNCYSWPLDATTGGRSASRSATWSANMSSNSRNVKLLFLTTRCHWLGGRGRSANRSATRCQDQGGRLASVYQL